MNIKQWFTLNTIVNSYIIDVHFLVIGRLSIFHRASNLNIMVK